MILGFPISSPTKLNGYDSCSMIVPESTPVVKLVIKWARAKKPRSGYLGDKLLWRFKQ